MWPDRVLLIKVDKSHLTVHYRPGESTPPIGLAPYLNVSLDQNTAMRVGPANRANVSIASYEAVSRLGLVPHG